VTDSTASWDVQTFVEDVTIYSDTFYLNNIETGTYGYDTGCRGICYAAFEGFGFNWTCTEAVVSDTYQVTPDLAFENSQDQLVKKLKSMRDLANGDAPSSSSFFNTTLQINPMLAVEAQFIPPNSEVGNANWNIPPPESISSKTYDYGSIALQLKWASLTNTTKEWTECSGQTMYRYCSLQAATMQYPVKIVNVTTSSTDTAGSGMTNGITIQANWTTNPNSTESFNDAPVRGQFDGLYVARNVYEPYDRKWDSNLLGIVDFIQANYGAYVLFESFNSTKSNLLYSLNYQATKVLNGSSGYLGAWWPTWGVGTLCVGDIEDPSYRIGTDLNNLLLRSSMRASTEWDVEETYFDALWFLNTTNTKPQSYRRFMYISSIFYKTNWWFGGAAMINVFVCILCVLPSYWGFWQLGRNVTLGPVEIASAFQAPILQHDITSTAGGVKQLVKEIGDRPVRYGEVEGQNKLGVAGPSEVRPLPR
jgi:hypothetical protein